MNSKKHYSLLLQMITLSSNNQQRQQRRVSTKSEGIIFHAPLQYQRFSFTSMKYLIAFSSLQCAHCVSVLQYL